MDELIQHCLRELAFDGDFGCDVARLKDFIVGFYSNSQTSSDEVLDDAFCIFTWSLMVRQPTVVVGLCPENMTSEIWIAPQTSAKRKAGMKGEEAASSQPEKLVSVPESKTTPLPILQEKYGQRLRLAVDPQTIFVLITGSHIRSAKLSPMVYSALQIVTRGREAGISVVDLGKRSGYDPKTCFYLVRQMTELDLVLKVRRGGVGSNFCIHKYFFERSSSWQAIREEETRAGAQTDPQKSDDNPREEQKEAQTFTSIDSRHLSSFPLVCNRVIKLLKGSANHVHETTGVLTSIGFVNPSRTDRRFFQTRIREMIQQKIIEKITVHNDRKNQTQALVKCYRLVEPKSLYGNGYLINTETELDSYDPASPTGIRFQSTAHKQIINLIEESSTDGMTLNDLTVSLNQFDRRTIELLLQRLEKTSDVPPHLLDLSIVCVTETSGRERHNRYFTLNNYDELITAQNLDKNIASRSIKKGAEQTGGFSHVDVGNFYDDEDALSLFMGMYPDKASTHPSLPTPSKCSMIPNGRTNRGRVPEDAASSKVAMKNSKAKQGTKRKIELESTELVGNFGSIGSVTKRARSSKRPKVNSAAGTEEGQMRETSIGEATSPPKTVHDGESSNAVPISTSQPSDNKPQSTVPEIAVRDIEQATSLPHDFNVVAVGPSQHIAASNRINVSHLRRENEIVTLLERSGGILNLNTKEFACSHMALLQTLADAGEAASAPPGTRIDKRTMQFSLETLEKRGRIKLLKTTVPAPAGVQRSTTLAYLPSVDDRQLKEFLNNLSRSFRALPMPMLSAVRDEGANSTSNSTSNLTDPPNLDQPQAIRVPSIVSESDRLRETFLAERSTMKQAFGFIPGRAMRCRQLHLVVLEAFQHRDPSPYIVSHGMQIVDISFLAFGLPLETYCSLVSPPDYDDGLAAFFATEEGKKTLTQNIPLNFHTALQVGRARARSRILELLDILRMLRVVTPLQPSTSPTPFITCPPCGNHPTSFDADPGTTWTVNTSLSAPLYWRFNTEVDIYLWGSPRVPFPLWTTVSISDTSSGLEFWTNTQIACLHPDTVIANRDSSSEETHWPNEALLKSLCRAASWKSGYTLSTSQIQYASQFTERYAQSSGDEQGLMLDHISWTTTASRAAIHEFFATDRESILRATMKSKRREEKERLKREKAKLSLAKKAEDAQHLREQDWAALLTKIHPGELPSRAAIRMERVRKHFMRAGSMLDFSKWENEIQTALRESDLAKIAGFKIPSRRPARLTQTVPGPASIHPEVSVYDLIQLQGPPLDRVPPQKKRKRDSDQPTEVKPAGRRHRFQWNADFDELARDASVIIRARCHSSRLDLTALEQVFPAVPRNTVRQRLASIRECPGNETYLHRLEESWKDLWIKHRGTAALPDEDIQSTSNFDLIKHIEFLRHNIDKASLRLGVASTAKSVPVVMPNDVLDLNALFTLAPQEFPIPEWDFMYNYLIEEGREKRLKRQVFSRCYEVYPALPHQSESALVAEAALKMVFGTPPEAYDAKSASTLLKNRDWKTVKLTQERLLDSGVLSKVHRDVARRKPGPSFKISEYNQNAMIGSISGDTFEDAALLTEEMSSVDASLHEWPLVATDGDCAALIQMVSDGSVDFSIDTSLPQAARSELDWNSKKCDDDQIEPAISVSYQSANVNDKDRGLSKLGDIINTLVQPTTRSEHGFNANEEPACCRQQSTEGLVDCEACLEVAWDKVCSHFGADSKNLAEAIMKILSKAEHDGIDKSSLITAGGQSKVSLEPVLLQLLSGDIPQVFWAGYETLVLVSARYASKWSVVTSVDPLCYVLPRRWLDVKGQRISDFWTNALRAVMGLLVFRPGIAQIEIRWRLRQVYDRQEINEVLRYLRDEGFLQVQMGGGEGLLFPYDDEEERRAHWFVGDRYWYHV